MSYKNLTSATIIKDSINKRGERITTIKMVFPRYLLAELNTHRMFSRNSASSRAIPFKKMVKSVEDTPFIPMAFQEDHKGMQGTSYLTGIEFENAVDNWLLARDSAIINAKILHSLGVTKQLCNRILEPFIYHTVLITATEWDNFFELRCPKYEMELTLDDSEIAIGKSWKDLMDWRGTGGIWAGDFDTNDIVEKLIYNEGQGEIHIMDLAEKTWDAMNESTPDVLEDGEWHIPFMDDNSTQAIMNITPKPSMGHPEEDSTHAEDYWYGEVMANMLKVATARCARISYETLGDNPKIDYEADIKLHDTLLKSGHFSPFEHCGCAMTYEEYDTHISGIINDRREAKDLTREESKRICGWSKNFRGFIQYREIIEQNNN